MSALLFGSIGTIVDTSELQRQAFNQAFTEHGLGWSWEREDYAELLKTSGGEERIAVYAESQDDDVDAAAVHASKSTIFQTAMDSAQLTARPGVAEAIRRAKEAGVSVGLVTTTSMGNVTSMVGAVGDVDLTDFDVTISRDDVEQTKPDPAAYATALDRLGLSADQCLAIEDNIDGVTSANASGVTCVAFPNENTADHDFSHATHTIDAIDFDEAMKHVESN